MLKEWRKLEDEMKEQTKDSIVYYKQCSTTLPKCSSNTKYIIVTKWQSICIVYIQACMCTKISNRNTCTILLCTLSLPLRLTLSFSHTHSLSFSSSSPSLAPSLSLSLSLSLFLSLPPSFRLSPLLSIFLSLLVPLSAPLPSLTHRCMHITI